MVGMLRAVGVPRCCGSVRSGMLSRMCERLECCRHPRSMSFFLCDFGATSFQAKLVREAVGREVAARLHISSHLVHTNCAWHAGLQTMLRFANGQRGITIPRPRCAGQLGRRQLSCWEDNELVM